MEDSVEQGTLRITGNWYQRTDVKLQKEYPEI
jgi:hypothetical protein